MFLETKNNKTKVKENGKLPGIDQWPDSYQETDWVMYSAILFMGNLSAWSNFYC